MEDNNEREKEVVNHRGDKIVGMTLKEVGIGYSEGQEIKGFCGTTTVQD